MDEVLAEVHELDVGGHLLLEGAAFMEGVNAIQTHLEA